MDIYEQKVTDDSSGGEDGENDTQEVEELEVYVHVILMQRSITNSELQARRDGSLASSNASNVAQRFLYPSLRIAPMVMGDEKPRQRRPFAQSYGDTLFSSSPTPTSSCTLISVIKSLRWTVIIHVLVMMEWDGLEQRRSL